MRRIFVLALLFGAVKLIQPLGARGNGALALLGLGFLILCAYTAGELAESARLPKLVGYLVAGVVFGPAVLNGVNDISVAALTPVSGLAIALIAFLAGGELRWADVRARGLSIMRILATELSFSFVAMTAFLVLLRNYVPFLRGGTPIEVATFSLLFAAIAVVHSPAVTMGVLAETRARGPFTRMSLGVVMVSDVVVVLLLTAVLAFARYVVPSTGADVRVVTLASVTWEIAGAALVGVALGGLVALYLRVIRRELFLFAVLVALFGNEVAHLLRVEPLLTLIVAGFVAENISAPEHGAALRHAMERAAEPIFVVFFALTGAQIDLHGLAELWPLVLPLAVLRAGAIWVGCRVGARTRALPKREIVVLRQHLWTGLVAQAGVAIGLAAVIANTYPNRGSQVSTLFLALVTVNQLVGPILYRRALERAGEVAGPTPRVVPAPLDTPADTFAPPGPS